MSFTRILSSRLFSSTRRSKAVLAESASASVVSRFISNAGRLPELDINCVAEEGTRILGNMEKEMAKIKIGRATPSMLDSIKVAAEGYIAPLNSLATISVQDPQRLAVSPYESSDVKSIVAAINSANLNLNAVVEGSNRVLVTTPKATKELRENSAKLLSTISEVTKRRIRELRQSAMEECKAAVKDNDVRKQNERQLQAEIEKIIGKVESILAVKQKELLNQ